MKILGCHLANWLGLIILAILIGFVPKRTSAEKLIQDYTLLQVRLFRIQPLRSAADPSPQPCL